MWWMWAPHCGGGGGIGVYMVGIEHAVLVTYGGCAGVLVGGVGVVEV